MTKLVPPSTSTGWRRGLTRNVTALGVTSLLTDVSTEMILPVLPLFLVGTLRATATSVGLIEGVAECTATLLRMGSGWLSDRIGRRKPFLLLGYGLSGAAKAALAIAASWGAVLGLRFADRVGKGLRNPPRDALIADSVAPADVGRAFGFHRALDTLGAAIGPLVAVLLLTAYPGDFRRIFVVSAIPAALSLVVLVLFVSAPRREPARGAGFQAELGQLGAPYRKFLIVAGLFSLANSSTAFLLLLARRAGYGERAVPLVYLDYNLFYALLSWPIGVLSDRIGRRRLLFSAYLLFALLYGALAWRAGRTAVLVGFLVLGLHSALLEATQRSMVVDLVPAARRATAFGLYYAVVGLALLPASVIAGRLWDMRGPATALATDAALALLAALLFAVVLPFRDELTDRNAHAV